MLEESYWFIHAKWRPQSTSFHNRNPSEFLFADSWPELQHKWWNATLHYWCCFFTLQSMENVWEVGQRWDFWQSRELCPLTSFLFPLSLCHSCQLISDYGNAFSLPFSLSLVLHFVLSSVALNYCNFVLQSLINSCSVSFSCFHPTELKAMTPVVTNGVNAGLKYSTTHKQLGIHIMALTFVQVFQETRLWCELNKCQCLAYVGGKEKKSDFNILSGRGCSFNCFLVVLFCLFGSASHQQEQALDMSLL